MIQNCFLSSSFFVTSNAIFYINLEIDRLRKITFTDLSCTRPCYGMHAYSITNMFCKQGLGMTEQQTCKTCFMTVKKDILKTTTFFNNILQQEALGNVS